MKYLCLAYYDDARFNALPKTELDALVTECQTHDQDLAQQRPAGTGGLACCTADCHDPASHPADPRDGRGG